MRSALLCDEECSAVCRRDGMSEEGRRGEGDEGDVALFEGLICFCDFRIKGSKRLTCA